MVQSFSLSHFLLLKHPDESSNNLLIYLVNIRALHTSSLRKMYVIIHARYLLLAFAFSLVGSLSTNKAIIPSNRRHWLKHSVSGAITSILTINLEEVSCNAAETVGKDPNCNDARCLG